MKWFLKLRICWLLADIEDNRAACHYANRKIMYLERTRFAMMDKVDELRERINADS